MIAKVMWTAFIAFCCVFLVSPLIILAIFCFSEDRAIAFPINEFGFKWWGALFSNPTFWPSARNSMVVVAITGVVSTVIGTLAAFALARMASARAGIWMALLTLPVMLPPLVLGVALLSFFSRTGIPLGLDTVILAHILFTQPFVILIVHASMAGFDYAAVASARDLGASPFYAFRTVTLPIVRPSIIGAALVAMAISLDDFIITFFTIGGGNTLPTFLWGMLRKGVTPQLNIVAMMLMSITIAISIIAMRLTRYRG
jgi:spermidine/putrescine transport system permease protein